MRDILDIVKPTPDARYAVFYSFSEGAAGGGYYDVHEFHNMRHRLTILAYETGTLCASLQRCWRDPHLLLE